MACKFPDDDLPSHLLEEQLCSHQMQGRHRPDGVWAPEWEVRPPAASAQQTLVAAREVGRLVAAEFGCQRLPIAAEVAKHRAAPHPCPRQVAEAGAVATTG